MAEDGKPRDSAQDSANPPPPGPPPSIEDLARRLMDLWQEQMAAIAADPDLMRQMARMMAASPFPAMMQGIMQGMMAATANPAGNGGQNPYEWWKGDGGTKASTQDPSAPAGAPAAAAASQPGGGDLAELRRHLAGLEARLSGLGDAAGSAETPPGPAPKPKSKPKRAARKPAAKVEGPAGGSGEGGTGGAGGGAAG